MKKYILILLFLFISTPQINATEYNWYFSQSAGSDSGEGTELSPWQTMSKLQTQLNSTDTDDTVNVYLKKGDTWTFGDSSPLIYFHSVDGTTKLSAYGSGALPILDGQVDFTDPPSGRAWYDHVIWIDKASCVVEYIEIKNMFGGAIYLEGESSGTTIQYCNFNNWGWGCITQEIGSTLSNITVQYCTIHTGEQLWMYPTQLAAAGYNTVQDDCSADEYTYGCKHGGAIIMNMGNHDPSNVYQHNLIYNIYGEGININRGTAQYNIIYDTRSSGILLTTGEGDFDGGSVIGRYNLIFNTTDTTYTSGSYDNGIAIQDENTLGDNTTYDGSAYGNIVISRESGIRIYDNQATADNKMGPAKVYNNTLIDNKYNLTIGPVVGYSDIDVHNNASILYDRTSGTHGADWGDGFPGAAVSVTYNLYWTSGGSPTVIDAFDDYCVKDDPLLDGETKGSPVNWDGLTSYADLSFSDLLYAAESPLIDAGTSITDGEATMLSNGTNWDSPPGMYVITNEINVDGWDIGAISMPSGNITLTNAAPSGTIPYTGTVNLGISSNVACTVKRGAAGVDPGSYGACTATLTTTGGLSHSETVSTASNTSYTYYLYAQDGYGNEGSAVISFTTEEAKTATPTTNITLTSGGNATMTLGGGNITLTMTTTEQPSDDTYVTAYVSANNDDGYYTGSAWYSVATGSYLRLGLDTTHRSGYFRFDVDVPDNATISSAYLTLTCSNSEGSDFVCDIYGENANDAASIDNAEDWTAQVADLTTATVNWDIGSSTSGTAYTSPDLKTIVQEIVDDENGSNHIQLFLIDTASTGVFRPWAYEHLTSYAKLVITFSE
jgi:hypothetical protein